MHILSLLNMKLAFAITILFVISMANTTLGRIYRPRPGTSEERATCSQTPLDQCNEQPICSVMKGTLLVNVSINLGY